MAENRVSLNCVHEDTKSTNKIVLILGMALSLVGILFTMKIGSPPP